MTPQHRKSMAFATILRQLDESARNSRSCDPEDIHWADPTTLGLLITWSRPSNGFPVLVITARPEVNVPGHLVRMSPSNY
jgi:hypothetical protein